MNRKQMLELPTAPGTSNKAGSAAEALRMPAAAPRQNAEHRMDQVWPFDRDSYTATPFGDVVDRSLHAAISRMTDASGTYVLQE
jgi:hypothetical protein